MLCRRRITDVTVWSLITCLMIIYRLSFSPEICLITQLISHWVSGCVGLTQTQETPPYCSQTSQSSCLPGQARPGSPGGVSRQPCQSSSLPVLWWLAGSQLPRIAWLEIYSFFSSVGDWAELRCEVWGEIYYGNIWMAADKRCLTLTGEF